MKKGNKALIIIGVILLNVLVVFMIGQSLLGKTSEYEKTLIAARDYAEDDLCGKSIEKYTDVLYMKDTLDIRLEMLEVYERGMEIGEIVNVYDVFNAAEEVVAQYREETKAYETVCAFFMKHGKYEECAEALMQARDLKVSSKKIKKLREQVRYLYERRYSMYDEVLPCYDGYFTASADGMYSHLDADGSPYSDGSYDYLSSFSEGYAFATAWHPDDEQKSFIINLEEQRQVYLDGVEISSGVGAAIDEDGEKILLLAGKKGDEYNYYGIDGKKVFGGYKFAGRFRNNVAAVQKSDGKWLLINGEGDKIVKTEFEDVILNEFDECAPKGLIIASDGKGYHIYNHEGDKVGKFTCDYAKAFVDGYAAFMKDDKWGFVDQEGKIVIKPKYDDAKSFSNNMGAVKIDDEWSFINPDNKIVIEGNFEDVSYLNDEGICFVKIDGYWSSLEFYYTGE